MKWLILVLIVITTANCGGNGSDDSAANDELTSPLAIAAILTLIFT